MLASCLKMLRRLLRFIRYMLLLVGSISRDTQPKNGETVHLGPKRRNDKKNPTVRPTTN
ncbi:hypothetical protein RND81_03G173400 [Saponaria officinalis]|uniref:Secreted protein n=1 Tax=Saponaria officinalis TaxID=3572 RepID=A0AAW1M122_SAPOF